MALNGYARLTLNGTALGGDVTQSQVGGVDVSADHIELYEATFGVETAARASGSARASGRRDYAPIRFVKRIDRSTPLLYRALAQNENVEGDILLFDTDPADGTIRQFFTVGVQNARVTAISSALPDTRGEKAPWEAYEEVALAFATITFTHVPTGTEMEDQVGRML